jgi:hypothetical protein
MSGSEVVRRSTHVAEFFLQAGAMDMARNTTVVAVGAVYTYVWGKEENADQWT